MSEKIIKRRKITFRVPIDFYGFLDEYARNQYWTVNQVCRALVMKYFTQLNIGKPSSYYLGVDRNPTCTHCEQWEMNDHGEHRER